MGHKCGPGLHYSVDLRIQMYKPYGTGSVKIWKTGHTISADIRKFLQCAKTAPAASASCMEFHIACIRQADFWRRKAVILGRIACTWCTDAALCFRYHTQSHCVSLCLAQQWAVEKWLNRSRCRLGCILGERQKRMYYENFFRDGTCVGPSWLGRLSKLL